MKLWLTTGVVFLAGFAPAVESVVLKDAARGASLIFERTTVDGSDVETETWSIGRTSRIVKSTFSAEGVLLERMVSVTRGLTTQRTDATITAHGASVVSTGRNGAGPTSMIPLLNRQSITDPLDTWFSNKKPDKGATLTFMSFDPEFRYWEETSVTFEGRGSLDKSPEGNMVTRKSAKSTVHMVLDDKGLPLVWDDGRLHLVRTG